MNTVHCACHSMSQHSASACTRLSLITLACMQLNCLSHPNNSKGELRRTCQSVERALPNTAQRHTKRQSQPRPRNARTPIALHRDDPDGPLTKAHADWVISRSGTGLSMPPVPSPPLPTYGMGRPART